MHYFEHNIGEFASATQYLTAAELGLYVRLRDRYLSTEMPLQCNWIAIAMRLECKESVENVLNLLFEKDGDTYRSEQLDQMIDAYAEKAKKLSENAKKRWKKPSIDASAMQTESNGNANAMQLDSDCNAIGKPTINHKPLTNNHIKENKKKSDLVKPDGVEEELFDEWLGFKKSVTKAKTSQRMVDAMVREAAKAGISTSQAMVTQMENGWQGFKAEYVNKRNGNASFAFDPATVDYSKGLIDNGDGTYSF